MLLCPRWNGIGADAAADDGSFGVGCEPFPFRNVGDLAAAGTFNADAHVETAQCHFFNLFGGVVFTMLHRRRCSGPPR